MVQRKTEKMKKGPSKWLLDRGRDTKCGECGGYGKKENMVRRGDVWYGKTCAANLGISNKK